MSSLLSRRVSINVLFKQNVREAFSDTLCYQLLLIALPLGPLGMSCD